MNNPKNDNTHLSKCTDMETSSDSYFILLSDLSLPVSVESTNTLSNTEEREIPYEQRILKVKPIICISEVSIASTSSFPSILTRTTSQREKDIYPLLSGSKTLYSKEKSAIIG